MGVIKETRLKVKKITNDMIELDLGGGAGCEFPLSRLQEEMGSTQLDHVIRNLCISLKIQGIDPSGDKVALKNAIEVSSFKVIE